MENVGIDSTAKSCRQLIGARKIRLGLDVVHFEVAVSVSSCNAETSKYKEREKDSFSSVNSVVAMPIEVRGPLVQTAISS